MLLLTKGADGTDHLYFFRNDVVSNASMDSTNSDYSGVLGDIYATGKDGLQASNDLCRSNDGIYTRPRSGSMCLGTVYVDA